MDLIDKLIAVAIGFFLREVTRVWQKTRMIVKTVELPTLIVTFKDGRCKISIVGEYRLVNMSDLPINLRVPHPLGYNAGSRAFQFKLMPRIAAATITQLKADAESILQPVEIAPNSELTLLSSKNSDPIVERYEVSTLPTYLWLEVLEYIRVGHKRRFRHRAYLYSRGYTSIDRKEYWYRSIGWDLPAVVGRWIALPGKLLWKRRTNKCK